MNLVIFRKMITIKLNQLYLPRTYQILGIFLDSEDREVKKKGESLSPHVASILVGAKENKTH